MSRIAPARKNFGRAAAMALLLAAALPLLSGGAAAQCLPERSLVLNPATTPAFGSLRNFPPLPLAAHEYVLTFDDGPNPKTTAGLLSALADACVHGSFFMIGRYAEKYPDLVRMIAAQGHTLGSHSYDHADLTKMPLASGIADMQRGKEAVEQAANGGGAAGYVDRLFRFPDNYDTPELMHAAAAAGLIVASYDLSPEDWRNNPAQPTFDRFVKFLNHTDRGVIVMHEGQSNTLQLLPLVLAELRRRNVTIVRLTVP